MHDVVVVGAGPAGCIFAARLTEDWPTAIVAERASAMLRAER